MKIRKLAAALAATSSALVMPSMAHAGVEPFIGQVLTTGGNFCPRGFLPANGQMVAIASNPALFSLLGTIYGGDGTTTFALPNLNGRAAIGERQGPGLPNYALGQTDGTTTIQLTSANLPPHTHSGTLIATPAAGTAIQPTRNSLAVAPAGTNVYSTNAPTPGTTAGAVNLLATGGGQSFSNESPYLVVTHCIAEEGIFPSRP